MNFLDEEIEYIDPSELGEEPEKPKRRDVTQYTFPQAYAIAAELKALPAFELCADWAIETILHIATLKENLSQWEPLSALSMNASFARHFDSCERRIREVNDRYRAMEKLYDRVFDAESTEHFDECPDWAREAVKSFLDAWDAWEETSQLKVYSENALRHVRSALGCIRAVNERSEQKAAAPVRSEAATG